MNLIKIASRLFYSNLKNANQRLWLLTHIALATYILLVTVGESTLEAYLKKDMANRLGADSVLESDRKLAPADLSGIEFQADTVAQTQIVEVKLAKDTHWQSISLKGVDLSYPVKGDLKTADVPGGVSRSESNGPLPGEIWLDVRAVSKLGLSVGDRVQIGDQFLQLTAILLSEPDKLLSLTNFKPNGLIHLSTLETVKMPGVRVNYRYLIAHGGAVQTELEQAARQIAGVEFLSVFGGQHPLSQILKKGFNFIGLISIVLFILATIALDLGAGSVAKQQAKFYAIGMSLGLSRTKALIIWLLSTSMQFAGVLLLSLLFAVAIIQSLVLLIANIAPGVSVSWSIAELAGPTGLLSIIYLCSLLPLFNTLAKVSVKALLVYTPTSKASILVRAVNVVISFSAIALYYSDNIMLTFYLLISIALAATVVVLMSRLVFSAVIKLLANRFGYLSIVMTMMEQRIKAKMAQIIGIGLCLFLFATTSILSQNYSNEFELLSFENDGNLFIEEATQTEKDALLNWIDSTGSEVRTLSPFAYAKLKKINSIELENRGYAPSESFNKLQSNIRLNWRENPAQNNEIIGGDWHGKLVNSSNLPISVVDEVMEDLSLEMGDRLEFSISGQLFSYEIVSVHAPVPGKSFINFWFVQPKADEVSLAYMASPLYLGSVELTEEGESTLASFWARYPFLQMQSLDSITSKINGLIQVVSTVVLLFTGFLASICTLVVWTGVNAFINSDKKRNGLMLCFGLSKIQCYRMTALEWLITAFIANVGALSGSYVVVHLIYKYNLGVQYSTDPMQMGAVLLEGILALASFGFILSYSSFNVKPVDLLKDMEGEHPTSKAISPKRFKQIIFNFKRFQKLVK